MAAHAQHCATSSDLNPESLRKTQSGLLHLRFSEGLTVLPPVVTDAPRMPIKVETSIGFQPRLSLRFSMLMSWLIRSSPNDCGTRQPDQIPDQTQWRPPFTHGQRDRGRTWRSSTNISRTFAEEVRSILKNESGLQSMMLIGLRINAPQLSVRRLNNNDT